ncbi:beta-1,3-galactosyl-O-glycosyl-glycoprotein beta-1,6-N-acetylglucosaminyltransferase-like [Syngnathoides biaculeatus]|uniref:beta-1,3-galactosyl-O-glycosyl-glycoprotein beta-1,6-N-acetylglucosaminyltransferase-like n=1 Tax=Syngnathoides biaculeatus TaxID=300417 RepID=UPI002ADE44BF|nr:beta-1,3-galactosyl-O-glycosyl-glycoprotein beta-1,6-N-acetylglucosaminyltransferase-like [Syngnathoides biaculeatus]XP_061672940.1 beta-1,3-galactosyl-O-glycosyl-glycoprotein beta-1,6-N-acetylglucosaminyltransferase-like [Syngnathoides biaculeatus]XP_061672941.1 beta-1,3-galactosyl-O-glycosyl-glycoprotein beta-1,6-N-acetylglucosaminyltransferase-like [Syngnathoides biaculeatus]XP_061672942.1 beta-1,3-galactosyl-O-glycosyl-glycoprotein beta-1,6-N-acetylglucosaminyltransferase-like [Syngnathoi
MRCPRIFHLKQAILLSALVAAFGLLSLINVGLKVGRNPSSNSLGRYAGLDYGNDDDESPEKACNCSAVFRGEREALEQTKLLTLTKDFRKRVRVPDQFYVNARKDCKKFKTSRKYLTFPLSKEEEDFPLAYSMVVHQKVQNFERLLRAIYAPQNVYCVHVDLKASPSFLSAVSAVVACFPNVFLAGRREKVVYAGWSRVQADLNCMAELLSTGVAWKYFINLCGQDFPLKTNLEMVRALQALNGGNSMESEKMPTEKMWRVQTVHHEVDGQIQAMGTVKESPPFQLPILSGNAYIVVTRGFVRSVLEDQRVLALIDWAKDTYSPDEMLWASIQRMPGVPGSTWASSKYDMSDVNALAKLVKWQWHEGERSSAHAVYPPCRGVHIRAVCVYGAGDLQWLVKHRHLFANKFDTDEDPVAIYCLEKYLRQRALAQLQ